MPHWLLKPYLWKHKIPFPSTSTEALGNDSNLLYISDTKISSHLSSVFKFVEKIYTLKKKKNIADEWKRTSKGFWRAKSQYREIRYLLRWQRKANGNVLRKSGLDKKEVRLSELWNLHIFNCNILQYLTVIHIPHSLIIPNLRSQQYGT